MDAPKVTIFYDGLCNFCDKAAGTLASSSHAEKFELKDATKDPLPAGLTQEAAMRDVHVRDSDGTDYKGAPAVLRILEEYPQWRWLSRLGRLPVFNLIAAGIYRLIADNRGWMFGRKKVS